MDAQAGWKQIQVDRKEKLPKWMCVSFFLFGWKHVKIEEVGRRMKMIRLRIVKLPFFDM